MAAKEDSDADDQQTELVAVATLSYNNKVHDGRSDIIKPNGLRSETSIFEQYPYTYYIPISSSNLIISIIQWMLVSIVCSILLIILYPLLIPLYIIVMIQWEFNIIRNKKTLYRNTCKQFNRFLYKIIVDLGLHTIFTINSLIIAPFFYIIGKFNDNLQASSSLLIPSVLFFIFRKSVLLRLARWYLRFKGGGTQKGSNRKNINKIFPQWFLKYFIQSGLQFHYLLINDYVSDEIYLMIDNKFNGTFDIGLSKVNVSKFIIDCEMARNFYDYIHIFYRTLVSVAILLQLLTPFLFSKNMMDVGIHIILSVATFWIMIAIWFEIEGRLIFPLLKYLDRMRQFGELLYLDAQQKKDRTKYKRFDVKHIKNQKLKNATHCQFVIKLCDGYNANVWTENWLMMYHEANTYFNKFEYILYSIIISVIAAVLILIYNLMMFKGEKIFNIEFVVPSIGCFAIILIWIELLMISFKFSKLEKKHIAALINQKVWIKQTIFDLIVQNKNDKNDENVFRLERCVNLIDGLIQKMQIKGMSPKIAGIPMNDAFVRVTWSLTISIITAGLSYYIRRA